MSEWEDFCESNGWNAGSEGDYDRFLDSLEDRPVSRGRRGGGFNFPTVFETFQEASAWSKDNGGASFTRTADGKYFTTVKKRSGSA